MKTHLKQGLVACLLLGLLVSCSTFEPERLEFDTDPRILRDTWLGTYHESGTYPEGAEAIKLGLKAQYLNKHEYAVTGTLQIRTETLTLEGTMNGGERQLYVQMKAPVPPQLKALLKDAAGREVGTLSLNDYYSPDYYGQLEVVGKTKGWFTIQPQ
jgi:hypothetical protein